MLKQSRISFQPFKRDIYIKETVKQEGVLFPWIVKVEGWMLSGLSVKIEHAELMDGYILFANVKFKSAKHFADFTTKMLTLFRDSFKKSIVVRGYDYLALMEGYEKGKQKARSHFYMLDPS